MIFACFRICARLLWHFSPESTTQTRLQDAPSDEDPLTIQSDTESSESQSEEEHLESQSDEETTEPQSDEETTEPQSDEESPELRSDNDSSNNVSDGILPRFQYTSLQSDREIRILKLHAAGFHEPITCSLVHAPLGSTKHPYAAVSYTWGKSEDQVLIQVDGKSLGVTHNLAAALRYLRKNCQEDGYEQKNNKWRFRKAKVRGISLWIDAICINQEDIEEKTNQVSLMTKIYDSATQVICWLGTAMSDSGKIMAFFRKVGRGIREGDREVKEGRHSQELRKCLMDKSQNRLRRALEALLKRDYWTRAWIVQEVIMAKRVTLMCGPDTASWDHAKDVVNMFVEERTRMMNVSSCTSRRVSNRTGRSEVKFMYTFKQLDFSRLVSASQRGPEWTLQMLIVLRHFKSKDPRDKIFSLLGLINRKLFERYKPELPRLQVDYSLDFRSVSTRMFKYYLLAFPCDEEPMSSRFSLHKGSMNIICASQPPRSDGFPSWLPDFSKDNGIEPWPILGYQYCNFQEGAPYFSSDNRKLYVPAVTITTIDPGWVTGGEDDCWTTDDACLLGRIWTFMRLTAEKGPFTYKSWGDEGTGRVQRTEYQGRRAGQVYIMGTNMPTYLSLPEFATGDSPAEILEALERSWKSKEDRVLGFLDTFRRKSFGKRFAVFNIKGQHYPAIVPAESRPGDMICMLWDCGCPVILRTKHKKSKAYDFIGACTIPAWIPIESPSHYGPIETIMLQ